MIVRAHSLRPMWRTKQCLRFNFTYVDILALGLLPCPHKGVLQTLFYFKVQLIFPTSSLPDHFGFHFFATHVHSSFFFFLRFNYETSDLVMCVIRLSSAGWLEGELQQAGKFRFVRCTPLSLSSCPVPFALHNWDSEGLSSFSEHL